MIRYLGRTPLMRILDLILEQNKHDKKIVLNRIVEKTKLHPYSVSKFLQKLVEYEIINEEIIGERTKIYWLNISNPQVHRLLLIKDFISITEQNPALTEKIKERLLDFQFKTLYKTLIEP